MTRILAFSVLCAVLASCSILEDRIDPDPDEISVENRVGELLYFIAIELEASRLVDPRPYFSLDELHLLSKVAPDERAIVQDIAEYQPGDDVYFLFYAVRQSEGVERAMLVKMETVSANDLRESGGRVVITDL